MIGLTGAVVLLGMATACGTDSRGDGSDRSELTNDTSASERLVDENLGSYRGLTLRTSSLADVQNALGVRSAARLNEPWVPLGRDAPVHRGPQAVDGPPADSSNVGAYRYGSLFVMLIRDHVALLDVVEPGATTTRGVSIGDPIERAKTNYPELECGTVTGDPPWDACVGRMESGYYLWIGGDPIESIALSSVRLGGV